MDFVSLVEYGPQVADYGVTLFMGLAIAATCGLRAFLPLLAVNLLALTGRVELHESFGFLGSLPATLMFGTATIAELAGDKFPGVDHVMDAWGVVIKPAAATVAAAAFISHVDPLTAVALGLVGGGTSASVLGLAKAKVRVLSSGLTLGTGNVLLSLGEDSLVLGGLTLTVIAPMLAFGVVMFLAGCALVFVGHRRSRRRARAFQALLAAPATE